MELRKVPTSQDNLQPKQELLYLGPELDQLYNFVIVEITITITLENAIIYKLQLQLLVIDECFSLRTLNNIFLEINNLFEYDNKERTRPSSFF